MAKKDSPSKPRKTEDPARVFRKSMTLGVPIRGKNSKSKVSFPTDTQWRDWQIELAPSVNEASGDISTQWERASRNLYKKILVAETGPEKIEDEDREFIITRLSFCEAVGTEVNALTATIDLALFNSDPANPTHFSTTHVLKMPSEREIRDYRKNKLTENSRGGRRRIVTHPEVTQDFYNTLLKSHTGYGGISDISLLHKMQVILALEEVIEEFDRKEQIEIDFT